MTITADPEAPATLYWSGALAIEDVPTGDGRRLMPESLTWRDLPLPLMFQSKTPEGSGNPHAGAALAGRITVLWRDGATVYGAGTIDSGDEGANMARFLADGPLGVSVDMDDVDASVECSEEDEEGNCLDGELQLLKGRVMGATACAFPAIPDAYIAMTSPEQYAALADAHPVALAVHAETEPHEYEDSGDGTCTVCGKTEDEHAAMTAATKTLQVAALRFDHTTKHSHSDMVNEIRNAQSLGVPSLVAAAARMLPPETWFEDPDLQAVTPFTISDPDEHGNRRCYGHLARWGQPHIALAGRTAPKSGSAYAYFRTGSLRASCECPDRGGQVEIPVGTLTMGTGHLMDLRAGASEATAHYDNTGLAAAYLAAGEDEFGIWGAGIVNPSLSEERIVELRASAPSGDWRFIGGRLEMVRVLAVNTPGFPTPRAAFHVSDGRETALVAAGIVPPPRTATASERAALESRLAILEERFAQSQASLRALEPLVLERIGQRFKP